MSGFLFFVAFIGSVAMIAAFFYSAFRRIQKKLASESKPTTWDFINELGGYVVLLVVFALSVIGGLAMAIIRLF